MSPPQTSADRRAGSASHRASFAPELLVVASTLGGGTGSHLVRLLAELQRSGWSIRLLCHDPEAIPVPDAVHLIEDPPRGPLARFPFAQLAQLRRLKRVAAARAPDILHTFFFWPIVYGRLLKRMGAVEHLVENREDAGFSWGPFEYRILRRTAHLPDRVICVSESVRKVVLEREGLDARRVHVIRNGVPLPSAGPPPRDDAARLRAELGFGASHPIVGMVANLNRAVKGVHHFIDAFPRIADRLPEARFLIVGDGPDRAKLEERARRLGQGERVVFAGFRSDVERFYRIMDLSVLTSLSEGLSITILESMSFGVPVVATRVGGNPELVVDGTTGLLVPPADPGAFADAVVCLLADPALRERMGEAGRLRAEREFSQGAVARKYDDLYREVSKRHAVPGSG